MTKLAPEPTAVSGFRPLLVHYGQLYASDGLKVMVSDDGGRTFEYVGGYEDDWIQHLLSRADRTARLFRAGFHSLKALPNGALIGAIRNALVYQGTNSSRFERVLEIERGSRPLNLCVTPQGGCYFGEYFRNSGRESVRIYESRNGRNWRVAFTFAPGQVRHVHGIFWDPYRRGIWTLTGDDDAESALWFTDNRFRTLHSTVRGSQRARAVAVIPVPEGLIVPTDTPREQNYIQMLDWDSGKLSLLAKLPGSGFHAVENNGMYFVSTVVEPSPVNQTDRATIFASISGYEWKRLASLERERGWLKSNDVLFGYPQLVLVPTIGHSPWLYCEARGLKDIDSRLLRWDLEQVRQFLRTGSEVGVFGSTQLR